MIDHVFHWGSHQTTGDTFIYINNPLISLRHFIWLFHLTALPKGQAVRWGLGIAGPFTFPGVSAFTWLLMHTKRQKYMNIPPFTPSPDACLIKFLEILTHHVKFLLDLKATAGYFLQKVPGRCVCRINQLLYELRLCKLSPHGTKVFLFYR